MTHHSHWRTGTVGSARSGPAQLHTACTSHQHGPPGTAPGRGAGAPWSLRHARLFWAIVSPLPGGQVALSSAPVSHDSQRNPTSHRCSRVGSHAQTTCPRGAVPTAVPHPRAPVTRGPYLGRAHSGPGCTPAARRGGGAGGGHPPRAAAAGPPRPWRRYPSPACSAHTSGGEGMGKGVMVGWHPGSCTQGGKLRQGSMGTLAWPSSTGECQVTGQAAMAPQGKGRWCLCGSWAAHKGVGVGWADKVCED